MEIYERIKFRRKEIGLSAEKVAEINRLIGGAADDEIASTHARKMISDADNYKQSFYLSKNTLEERIDLIIPRGSCAIINGKTIKRYFSSNTNI